MWPEGKRLSSLLLFVKFGDYSLRFAAKLCGRAQTIGERGGKLLPKNYTIPSPY